MRCHACSPRTLMLRPKTDDASVARPYEEAMRRVADRLWESRHRTFDEKSNHSTGVAHLVAAPLDIEENYVMKKPSA